MAGFGYGGQRVQPQANFRGNISLAASYYGNGLYHNYNGGVQRIEGVTCQFGNFNGLGVGGSVYSQPMQVQRQMHHYKPHGAGGNAHHNNCGSGGWVQVGPNPNPNPHPHPYYMNMNAGAQAQAQTQTIQGDVVQRGTFNGRGMGARIHGHFCVSGDIN